MTSLQTEGKISFNIISHFQMYFMFSVQERNSGDAGMREFESRLTAMFSNLVEKNGFEIMSMAVEALKNMAVRVEDGKVTASNKDHENRGQKCNAGIKEKPVAHKEGKHSGITKTTRDIKIIVTSHKVELSVPPKAVVTAMEEILECAVCAGKHVWHQMKDFFAWIWGKLSNLLHRKANHLSSE
jgi:hypothetical protein